MPLTRSAARRSHRALSSDDVLSTVLSFLDPLAGFGAATTSKTMRDAWRRRCKGMLRFRLRIENVPRYAEGCVAYEEGVMAPDNGRYRNNGSLQTFSADGTLLSSLNRNLDTPRAVALRGDGTAWVILNDENEVVCVRLAELPSDGESEVLMRISPNAGISNAGDSRYVFLESLALAGDSLLVLCSSLEDDAWERRSIYLNVYDNQTGAFVRKVLLAVENGDGEATGTMAVQGDMLYITRRNSHTVDEYRWRGMTLMRRFGGGDQRLSFDAPFGIAIRGKTMYVSESLGRQIQVLRLPDDDSEPTVLQVIPSPDGQQLGGLCLNGDKLWCVGPKQPPVTSDTVTSDTWVHLFGPCYE